MFTWRYLNDHPRPCLSSCSRLLALSTCWLLDVCSGWTWRARRWNYSLDSEPTALLSGRLSMLLENVPSGRCVGRGAGNIMHAERQKESCQERRYASTAEVTRKGSE
jgi:hypothetical protein